ncbi:hypothetical protein MASR2M29_19830 [Spirochaetota bacterium]
MKKIYIEFAFKGARFRDYEEAFTWLEEAMITNSCFNASDPSIGLSLYKDRLTLKMYMADTGLLLSHTFSENDALPQEAAKQIIEDKLDFNKGMIFENIVAQMLVTQNKKLYFYSRTDKENSANTMEIDFLIMDKTNPVKISPIEVKSGKHYTTSSLQKFNTKFLKRLGKKYILHTKDLAIKDDIIFLPVYMTMFL